MRNPASPDLRLLYPRDSLTGVTGDSLGNIVVDELPDGSLCMVPGQGLYLLEKSSTAAVSSPTVIATGRGAAAPGRWVQFVPATAVASPIKYWVDPNGPSTGADGTIMKPFQTPQDAIDALVALEQSDVEAVIRVSAGDYRTADGLIIPAELAGYPLIKFIGDDAIFTQIGNEQSDAADGIQILCDGEILAKDINIDGRIATSTAFAFIGHNTITNGFDWSSEGGQITLSCDALAYNGFDGDLETEVLYASRGGIIAPNCEVNLANLWCSGVTGGSPLAAVSAATLYAINCQFTPAMSGLILISGDRMETRTCAFTGTGAVSIVFAVGGGVWRIDGVTNYYWEQMTETLTNATKTIINDVT